MDLVWFHHISWICFEKIQIPLLSTWGLHCPSFKALGHLSFPSSVTLRNLNFWLLVFILHIRIPLKYWHILAFWFIYANLNIQIWLLKFYCTRSDCKQVLVWFLKFSIFNVLKYSWSNFYVLTWFPIIFNKILFAVLHQRLVW